MEDSNSVDSMLGLHRIRNSLIVTSIVIFLGLIMGYFLSAGVSIDDKLSIVSVAHDNCKLLSTASGEPDLKSRLTKEAVISVY